MKILLNKKSKKGGWWISSDYITYRQDGGSLLPAAWNERVKELEKERTN
jgi:hypothetical protein